MEIIFLWGAVGFLIGGFSGAVIAIVGFVSLVILIEWVAFLIYRSFS